jgi:hypothetical protein
VQILRAFAPEGDALELNKRRPVGLDWLPFSVRRQGALIWT